MKRIALLTLALVAIVAALASARTTSSVEVTGLTANASTPGQVTLAWSLSSTSNVLNELVEEQQGTGSWTKLPLLPASARSDTLSLAAGSYHFRVWAVVKAGVREVGATVVAPKTEEPPVEEKPKEEPVGKERTTWTAPGSLPLADSEAAKLVIHHEEKMPVNATFNRYVPTSSEISAFHSGAAGFSPLSANVDGLDGLTSPSTDDLIQWAADKWGIPVDWMRADDMQESGERQLVCTGGVACNSEGGPAGAGVAGAGFGDCEAGGGPPAAVHAVKCEGGTFASVGISQVKEQSAAQPGTYPLAWKSTAFAEDYRASIIRYYYDGYCGWCTFAYKGREWESLGAWFSPGSNSASAQKYVSEVQGHLARRDWPQ